MKLNESGACVCGGWGAGIGLHVPFSSLRAARHLGHPQPGRAPSREQTLGPALRNEGERVSSGARTQTWEDPNDVSGSGLRRKAAVASGDPVIWGRGGLARRRRGEARSEGLGPAEEGTV